MQYISNSLEETAQIATNLGSSLKPGSVLALCGDLGVGKTTFTQSLARSLGIDRNLQSPTFIIMRQYDLPGGGGVFNHLDLYRTSGPDDLKAFDMEELFSDKTAYTIIEWPEKIADILPEHTIKIYFEITGENTRKITINI